MVLLIVGYRHSRSEHVRRQVRLIACAVLLIFGVRILLRSATTVDSRLQALDGLWVDVLWVLIPLAYLAGGVSSDLRRLDRVAGWLTGHLITACLLAAGIGLIVALTEQQSSTTRLFATVAFVGLYYPVHHQVLLLSPSQRARRRRTAILTATTDGLSRSLDFDRLWSTLVDGIQAALGTTSFAVFRSQPTHGESLCLDQTRYIENLPSRLAYELWQVILRQVPRVVDSAALQRYPGIDNAQVRQVVDHPSIAAWCVICTTDRPVGLLLLGFRDDLSGYDDEELGVLDPVVAAASIAFANSAEYQERVAREEEVRALYQRLQTIEDQTKKSIATEIHDEIINGHLVIDIRALERILMTTDDPLLRDELTVILESDRTVVDMLRRVGHWLYPPGIDNPVGLPGVLKDAVERHQSRWLHPVAFEVCGTPVPLKANEQLALLRIVREALANAAKHANATQVRVKLSYPIGSESSVRVDVEDDGQGVMSFERQAGHYGLQSLEEYARGIGADFSISSSPVSGTHITVTLVWLASAPAASENLKLTRHDSGSPSATPPQLRPTQPPDSDGSPPMLPSPSGS